MTTTSTERMRAFYAREQSRRDRLAMADTISKSLIGYRLPKTVVLVDWHIDSTGCLARSVGCKP